MLELEELFVDGDAARKEKLSSDGGDGTGLVDVVSPSIAISVIRSSDTTPPHVRQLTSQLVHVSEKNVGILAIGYDHPIKDKTPLLRIIEILRDYAVPGRLTFCRLPWSLKLLEQKTRC